MTPEELVEYYSNLLILQYLQQPKAYATVQSLAGFAILPQTSVQEITFSGVAASGTFTIAYGSLPPVSFAWNASAASIQSTLAGLSSLLTDLVVTGSIAGQSLVFTFLNTPGVAQPLTVTSSLLNSSSHVVSLTVTETDETLPLAVQDGFNLLGDSPAVGAQLDILAKYVGVVRTGYGVMGPVTLDDAEFLTLIKFATLINSAGSSLAEIQADLFQFFPNEILVFDYQNMHMSYLVSSSLGDQDLIQLIVNQGLLPKPMGVQLGAIIYAPIINAFFGFRTYELPAFNSSPFNDYASYQTDWPWLSYEDALSSVTTLLTEDGLSLETEAGATIYID